ncbi:hypothetical protein LX73_0164 [Fodinibius salinus]|uniref:Uncharacterized protein n=1 Tax=Fodinibius salinus TaxID=860790 RepID=A0A5D3YLP8_9BACT|nr:hypothetical protein LX73_0164 [Fodinibius salinus]
MRIQFSVYYLELRKQNELEISNIRPLNALLMSLNIRVSKF